MITDPALVCAVKESNVVEPDHEVINRAERGQVPIVTHLEVLSKLSACTQVLFPC